MFLRVVKVLQHTAEGDRTCPLQVGVSQQQGQARSLTLTLTDPADYFFYFSVTITEDDFVHLRQQQGLLVDFANFPSMLGTFL